MSFIWSPAIAGSDKCLRRQLLKYPSLLMLRVGVMIGAARAWRSSPLDDPLRADLAYSVEGMESEKSSVISKAIKDYTERESLPSESVFRLAVTQGYVDAVRDLLRLGAIPAAVHEDGTTPLHRAAEYGRARIVEMLVQDGGADVDVLSAKNETALCVAVAIEHVRTTKAFLRLGANPNVVCHSSVTMKMNLETVSGHEGHEGHPPLFFAAKTITDELLRHGADVDARDTTPNYKGYTALLHAAALGELDVVRSLLDAGADIETKCDVRGNTPLYGAVVNNHPRVVEFLLAHNANASHVNDEGWTPLGCAAVYADLQVVKALLKAGAATEARITTTGSVGVEVTATSYTALLHAAALGRVDVVRSLLKAGADIEAKVEAGRIRGSTPLYLAALNNHPKVVEVLLAHNAIISHVNDDGWTPLGAAASKGHIKVVKALLKAGADPFERLENANRARGKSPKEIAEARGHKDVVAAMTRADRAANPRRDSSEKNWGPVVAAVLVILGISWRLGHFSRMFQWYRARQAGKAEQDLLGEDTAQEPRRRNRGAQARESEPRARPEPESTTGGRPRRRRRHRPHAPTPTPAVSVAAPPTARAPTPPPAADGDAEVSLVQQERLDREATARAREDARRDRDAAAEAARAALDREAAEAARAALDRETAAFWEWEARYSEAAAWAARAAVPEEKSEEPEGREESKYEPARRDAC